MNGLHWDYQAELPPRLPFHEQGQGGRVYPVGGQQGVGYPWGQGGSAVSTGISTQYPGPHTPIHVENPYGFGPTSS